MDGYNQNGEIVDHLHHVEAALKTAQDHGQKVDKVLVWKRYPTRYISATELLEGRDYIINDLLHDVNGKRVPPVSMPSEAPLFLVYTSGATGTPKGCQHSTGGYLAYVAGTSKYFLDIQPEDVYWCTGDIGWITGHSYVVYGPLTLAATSVMYEGSPTCPDPGRFWRIAQMLDVNIFHTTPTIIRQLRKAGYDEPDKYNYNFKLMATVGEPLEPEIWRWYYEKVGKGKAAVVDTYWQTETGGIICSTIPAVQPMKPGSTGPAGPGIHPIIYDEAKQPIEAGAGKAGNLCIRNPWPGAIQTIWGNRERFVKTYYAKYCVDQRSMDWRDWPYITGDAAVLPDDGYYRILGRVDDVINTAGHRLGTKEIESACLTVSAVAEAAVVPVKDEIMGLVPVVYISLKPAYKAGAGLQQEIKSVIETIIGKIASPRHVHIVPDLPKTRSGKIMRRILAMISNGIEIKDQSSITNPEIIETIKETTRSS